MSLKYCPECNHVAGSKETKFCFRDGTKLKNYVPCPDCAYPQGPYDKFCEGCGRKVA